MLAGTQSFNFPTLCGTLSLLYSNEAGQQTSACPSHAYNVLAFNDLRAVSKLLQTPGLQTPCDPHWTSPIAPPTVLQCMTLLAQDGPGHPGSDHLFLRASLGTTRVTELEAAVDGRRSPYSTCGVRRLQSDNRRILRSLHYLSGELVPSPQYSQHPLLLRVSSVMPITCLHHVRLPIERFIRLIQRSCELSGVLRMESHKLVDDEH